MKVMLIDSLGIIGFNLVDFHLQEGVVFALIDAIFRCGSVANLSCLENKSAIFVFVWYIIVSYSFCAGWRSEALAISNKNLCLLSLQ